MAATMAYELLKREVETLPVPLAEQVLDFITFIKSRYAEDAFLWKQVETTQARRRKHPEEVMTVTAEEWDTLTAYLDGEG
ncbi:MAG: hypothetical protein FJ011_04785 [Chloroflexi bacterium]|jgi:hypothetical protein|nr:hypothetical protein [Chloroflexota bacterium]